MDPKSIKKLADKCLYQHRETKKRMGEVIAEAAYNYINAHPHCGLSAQEVMSVISKELNARKKMKTQRKRERERQGGKQIPLFH